MIRRRSHYSAFTLFKEGLLGQVGWQPTWGFAETVRRTAAWYQQFHQRGPRAMRTLSLRQIEAFVRDAARAGLPWAQEKGSR